MRGALCVSSGAESTPALLEEFFPLVHRGVTNELGHPKIGRNFPRAIWIFRKENDLEYFRGIIKQITHRAADVEPQEGEK